MIRRVTIKQPENEPEIPVEIITKHIMDIAQAMKKIGATRLKKETIVLLIHDYTKLPKRDIKQVLDCMEVLENVYLKPRKLINH